MMCGLTGTIVGTEVENALRNGADRCGQMEEARRTRAVVEVLIPFVSQRVGGKCRNLCTGKRSDGRVAPETHLAVGGGDAHVRRAAVHGEDVSGQTVLGTSGI